jgi:hypothetical protein
LSSQSKSVNLTNRTTHEILVQLVKFNMRYCRPVLYFNIVHECYFVYPVNNSTTASETNSSWSSLASSHYRVNTRKKCFLPMLLILSEKNLYPVFCITRISIMTVGKSGGHFETKKRWIRMLFEFWQSTATKKAVDCSVKNASE